MRQVVSGEEPVSAGGEADSEQYSTKQWDNDDYVASLKRKPDEIHQEWARPKRRLWHNDDYDPAQWNNNKVSDEVAEGGARAMHAFVLLGCVVVTKGRDFSG